MVEFSRYPMLMDPCFSPRPWGGEKLRSALAKPTQPGEKIGESWELSDHPHGRSKIANGPYAGKFFGDIYSAFPRQLCGSDAPPARFPLLVKYIDARDDLSIQVHPGDAAAAKRGDRGKTECWYIMDCEQSTEVILGLDDKTTPDSLRRAADAGVLDASIRRLPIRRGSFLRLPAGVVHAILGGTLLCEVQQSSDLTYRLWDWGRVPPRPLHLDDAIQVSRYGPGNAPEIIETDGWTGERELWRNEYFETRLAVFPPAAAPIDWRSENRHGMILNVLEGGGAWEVASDMASQRTGEFRLGETWFWPAGINRAAFTPGPSGLRLLVSRSLEF